MNRLDLSSRILRPRALLVTGLVAALAVITGCSSSGSSAGASGGSTGLPSTITVPAISETTGAAGPAGQASEDGQKVAVAQINSTKFLGNTKLVLNFEDTGSQPAEGAALVNQAAQSGAQVILGSILSTTVAAEAPVATRVKVPLIYLSSSGQFAQGSTYVWAATPPATLYFHWEAQYLVAKKATNVAIIYNNDVVSTAQWAQQTWPALAKQYKLNIVDTEASPTTTTDPSSAVAKLLSKKPDAVLVMASGTANNPIVLALKRSGFTGIIAGSLGMSGAVNPLGSTGTGLIWPTTFTSETNTPTVTAFDNLYKKQFNTEPNNYAAAAYDEVWFLARALKLAGKYNAAAINAALQRVGNAGFTGALGTVTYKQNVAQAAGLLIQWNGTNQTQMPVKGYGS